MVKIIADSTCDLSKELIEKYEIGILPLHIILGEKEFDDGRNITPDEIFRWSDANNQTPKTSAPSIAEAASLMEPYLKAGREIVCFSISSHMSASGNVMRMAAEELEAEERVSVIDSASLSTGIGLQVIEAAIQAQAGKSREEIVRHAEAVRPLVRASFVVDTLIYLYRGGRCSGLAAMAGGMLKLHPRIVVENGNMSPDKKYRGRIAHVIMDYVKELTPALQQARPERVFITHSECPAEIVSAVRDYLRELDIFAEIHETLAGGVISSHCGPGTLGVLFIAKDGEAE